MANAKKCDRCGNFYEKNSKYTRNANGSRLTIGGMCHVSVKGHAFDMVDLCDDCLSALDNFLNMVEVEW